MYTPTLKPKRLFRSRPAPVIVGGRTLSDYLPRGSYYFYGYPAGAEAGFLNQVPPATEELVAARAFSCAGPGVHVVSFAATCSPNISAELLERLRVPQLQPRQTLVLPATIDQQLVGSQRNSAIKKALAARLSPRTLIMAQPFTDDYLAALYRIPPALTVWLNDKKNLTSYLDESLVPQRLASYSNGAHFLKKQHLLQLPYVVKASSSSSGDGVCICLSAADEETAAAKLGAVNGTIVVEQYIEAAKNYGVHFGVPHDAKRPIEIVGINEQLTSPGGAFLGGLIKTRTIPPELSKICSQLLQTVLPALRAKGWYGIGCFDVLVAKNGRSYFIDGNFRMTGMSAYHFLVGNGRLRAPLVSFGGSFHGSQPELEEVFSAFKDRARLIALSHNSGIWNFNGALMHDGNPRELIGALLKKGIVSDALTQLLDA